MLPELNRQPRLKIMKKILSILITFIMLISIASPAQASDDGPVSGSFKLNTIPQITDLKVYTDSSLSTVATSLRPQQSYWIKLSLSVTDTLADLGSVRIWLAYGPDGIPNLNTIATGANNPSNLELFSWFKAFPDEIANGMAGTTWKVEEDPAHPFPSNAQLAEGTTVTAYDFVFKVTIGKLAMETADTATNKWHILTVVGDGSSSNANYAIYNNGGVYGLPMDWYGEITITPGTKIEWGDVRTGMSFTDSLSMAQPKSGGTVTGISFASNGDYSEGVKVVSDSLNWTTSDSHPVRLKNDHNNTADTFSLLATRGTVTNILTEGKSLLENSNTQVMNNTGTITMSGNNEGYQWVTTYKLYLSLSQYITYPGTYTGAINFVILNR